MRINGVFQGGGVKGIGLAGAIYAAEQRGITFHQTAGTSVGAVVAALVAAGYSGEEMRDLLLTESLDELIHKSWIHHIYFVGPAIRLLVKKGLYSGDPLEQWIRGLLAKKGIHTFGDLPKRALRVVASDISQGRMLVLPDDIANYGVDPMQLPVARAVRMSASIPFFFDPVTIRLRGKGRRFSRSLFGTPVYIVDGAILSNLPLWIFDKEMKELPPRFPTIGFQLVGAKEPGPRTISGPISMLQALFATMSEAHDLRYIEKHSRFRTVKIPSEMVHTTDFSISKDKLGELFASGFQAGDEFFANWTYSNYSADYDKWVVNGTIAQKGRPEPAKRAASPQQPPPN